MAEQVDILIIGGGAAGIAAARRLANAPVSVWLVEASPRLGGRARTEIIAGMPLDLGCYWLHSADRNSWAKLAREVDAAIDETPPAWREQWQDIGFSKPEQTEAGAAFAAFDKRLREDPPGTDIAGDRLEPGCRWNPWLDALSGFINGAGFGALSVRDYLAYEDADSDVNHRVVDGYGAFVCAAMPDARVSLGVEVAEVDRSGPLLRAITNRGMIEARAIIVTVSTAVLAAKRLRFTPVLPDKVEAASHLPLGLANKAFLRLDRPEPFEPDTQLIGNPFSADSGSYYLRPFGRPVIECFFGGDGARALEAEGEGAASAFAINQLAGLLGSDMRRLTPLAETRWASEPLIGGSYSHAEPGHAGARATLAAPVENRIFFAGEACSAHDFSTAHGAHDSAAAAEAALEALT